MDNARDRPPRYGPRSSRHRSARALACHTCMRAGFPRHAAIAGPVPRATVKNGPFHRRARALAGFHTSMRGPKPYGKGGMLRASRDRLHSGERKLQMGITNINLLTNAAVPSEPNRALKTRHVSNRLVGNIQKGI